MKRPMFIVLQDEKNPGRLAIGERGIGDDPTYMVICRDICGAGEITAQHMVDAFERYAARVRRKAGDNDWRF